MIDFDKNTCSYCRKYHSAPFEGKVTMWGMKHVPCDCLEDNDIVTCEVDALDVRAELSNGN